MNKPKKGFLVLPLLLLLMAAGCSNADEAEQAHTYETKVHTKEIQTNHKDAPSSTEAGKKTVSETETTAKTVPETQQSDADTDIPSQPDTSSQIETTETKTSQDNTKIVSNSEEAVALLKQRFDTTDDS
ncbi:hypothetical protein SAMN05421663_105174 [Terribacillus halophilus]|uniref:Uncharacterized protein n=1 Tax=Terribacillus halophilus TaxID=361279 RepID=A0A1G6QPZ1_9BACI|nr:hypothetical protein [Terribacillus halophilus]SDC94450.1 hypothetical protein SAMN05421663_105174 [Terribacillus halophilus]